MRLALYLLFLLGLLGMSACSTAPVQIEKVTLCDAARGLVNAGTGEGQTRTVTLEGAEPVENSDAPAGYTWAAFHAEPMDRAAFAFHDAIQTLEPGTSPVEFAETLAGCFGGSSGLRPAGLQAPEMFPVFAAFAGNRGELVLLRGSPNGAAIVISRLGLPQGYWRRGRDE